ncbi:MAG: hypothetical protein ACO32I_07820, partial [Candidatus Limnocylindrus sp.]
TTPLHSTPTPLRTHSIVVPQNRAQLIRWHASMRYTLLFVAERTIIHGTVIIPLMAVRVLFVAHIA